MLTCVATAQVCRAGDDPIVHSGASRPQTNNLLFSARSTRRLFKGRYNIRVIYVLSKSISCVFGGYVVSLAFGQRQFQQFVDNTTKKDQYGVSHHGKVTDVEL